MLQTPTVVYCAVDTLVPVVGRIVPGFEEFTLALERANIPIVWVTRRTRLQIDDPRQKLGHNQPFLAEDGGGVYLPEGYFQLRAGKTVRLGRFTCIPVAEPQPAASEALEALSTDLGVSVVPLSSLSPTEFAQNSGLPPKEAGLARHRDFDELFFFAGAGPTEVDRFLEEARSRRIQVRQLGAIWSLAVGASVRQCVRELSKLYQRTLRSYPPAVGICTTQDYCEELLQSCDRGILLTKSSEEAGSLARSERKIKEISLAAPNAWEHILAAVGARNRA